jgi:serine/threonine-protein kinase
VNHACPRCGTRYPTGRLGICPVCLLEAEIPPARLGDSLELLEEIGRGGMGSVHRARHLRLGRDVAVKFISERWAADPAFERRFEREARALAQLNHPGIVAVHDFGRDGGRSYLVMEYVDGRPLAALLPLPAERAIEIAAQLCDALAYAHARGVVHRDVKPANVLVDAAGRAKLSDFGIARLLAGERADTTATAGVLGTPAYMAPEALAGAPPDPRMDVYALGVVLYEMITGRPPQGDLAGLSPPLDRIVRRALATDLAERYPGAEAMGRDLASARTTGGELPGEERTWRYAVALLHTLTTAAVLWAFLLSVTPRVLAPGDVQPLIMLRTETLSDGRIVSRARFETWPTLLALAAVVVSLLAHGVLRRHWRTAGLDRPQPHRPVRESRLVLLWGGVALAVYVLRRAMEAAGHGWVGPYAPILGGLIEVAALYCVWVAVLEASRRARPLFREPALWGGFALALIPPAVDLVGFLATWQPR